MFGGYWPASCRQIQRIVSTQIYRAEIKEAVGQLQSQSHTPMIHYLQLSPASCSQCLPVMISLTEAKVLFFRPHLQTPMLHWRSSPQYMSVCLFECVSLWGTSYVNHNVEILPTVLQGLNVKRQAKYLEEWLAGPQGRFQRH